MKSSIFYSNYRKSVEQSVKKLLNQQDKFLSPQTAQSTRAVGDAVEEIISNNFERIIGDKCADYQADFARRSMADLAFTDNDNLYYVVDVKTH